MIFYYSFYILSAAILLQDFYFKTKISAGFVKVLFFLIFLLPAMRGDVGLDTYSYKVFYENAFDRGFVYSFLRFEPLFSALVIIQKFIFNNYQVFKAVVSIIQVSLLYFIVNRLYHGRVFLFLYVVIFYLDFNFNVLRAGLAVLVLGCYVLFQKEDFKKSLMFFSAPLFHFSAVFLYPYVLGRRFFERPKYFFPVLLVMLLFSIFLFFVLGDRLVEKLEIYIGMYSSFNFSTIFFVFLIGLLFSSAIDGRVSKSLLLAQILLLFAMIIYSFLPIGYRLVQISLFLYALDLCRVKRRVGVYALGFTILLSYFYIFNQSYSQQAEIAKKGSSWGAIAAEQSPLVPYRVFWQAN